MKLGYFADGPWAHKAFEKIFNDPIFEIAFICVRNDFQDPILKELGKKHQIPVIFHPKINSSEFINTVKEYGCDILVSMSFNQIFREELINLTPLKIINCHAGKLPFYRGRNILNWALINDEKEFGITVHFVDEGIDTGDVILQKTFPISDNDTYKTLLETAYVECANVLYAAMKDIASGKSQRTKQSTLAPVGFYCGRRMPGDEIINWSQTSRELFNFIRAVCIPGPRATTYLGSKKVMINKSVFIKDIPTYKGFPGQILGKTKEGFLVKTLDGYIEILEIEIESGGTVKTGDRFTSMPSN